jgi:hypothetical protein
LLLHVRACANWESPMHNASFYRRRVLARSLASGGDTERQCPIGRCLLAEMLPQYACRHRPINWAEIAGGEKKRVALHPCSRPAAALHHRCKPMISIRSGCESCLTKREPVSFLSFFLWLQSTHCKIIDLHHRAATCAWHRSNVGSHSKAV